jgi:hypothetical protein
MEHEGKGVRRRERVTNESGGVRDWEWVEKGRETTREVEGKAGSARGLLLRSVCPLSRWTLFAAKSVWCETVTCDPCNCVSAGRDDATRQRGGKEEKKHAIPRRASIPLVA